MLSEPAAWKRLLGKLVTVQADYLLAQAAAGAQALQVFDSWAGRALGREDYLRYVAPHNRELFAKVAAAGVPVINFSLGVSAYLSEAASCGGDVVGLDWSLPLDEAWERVGFERPDPGQPRSGGPARPLARASLPDRRRARAGRGPSGPRVQRRARPHSARRPSTACAGSWSTCASGPRRERSAPDRRPRDGLRRARIARRDPRLPRGHPPRATDASFGSGRDHGELPSDRRELTAPRGEPPPGRRARRPTWATSSAATSGMRHWSPWIEEVVGEMVDDGVTHAVSLVLAPHFSALSVARYQQKVADGLELYRGRIQVRARRELPRRSRSRGGFRGASRRRALALARGRARARARRLQRAQPPGARALVGRSVRRAVPRDGAARRGAGRARRRLAGRGRTSRPDARPSHGRGPISASISRRSRRRGVRDVVSMPGRLRLRSRRAPLRRRPARAAGSPKGSACGSSGLPALNDDPVFIAALADIVRERAGALARWERRRREGRRHRRRDCGARRRSPAGGARRRAPSWSSATTRLGGKIRTERVDGFVDRGRARQLPLAEGARRRAVRGARPRRRARSAVGRSTRARSCGAVDELHPLPEGLTGMIPANLDALERAALLSPEGKARFAAEARASPRRGGRRRVDRVVRLASVRARGLRSARRAAHDRDLRRRRRAALAAGDVSAAAGARARARQRPPRAARARPPSGDRGRSSRCARAWIALVSRTRRELSSARRSSRARWLCAYRAASGGYEVELDGRQPLAADGVVVATPAFATAELARGARPRARVGACGDPVRVVRRSSRSRSRARTSEPLDGYGYVVPRVEGTDVLACTWTSQKWEGRAPERRRARPRLRRALRWTRPDGRAGRRAGRARA